MRIILPYLFYDGLSNLITYSQNNWIITVASLSYVYQVKEFEAYQGHCKVSKTYQARSYSLYNIVGLLSLNWNDKVISLMNRIIYFFKYVRYLKLFWHVRGLHMIQSGHDTPISKQPFWHYIVGKQVFLITVIKACT